VKNRLSFWEFRGTGSSEEIVFGIDQSGVENDSRKPCKQIEGPLDAEYVPAQAQKADLQR
jgi:hypothetical protein